MVALQVQTPKHIPMSCYVISFTKAEHPIVYYEYLIVTTTLLCNIMNRQL